MASYRSPIENPEKISYGDHLVQFYKTDEFLTETVTNFIAPALMNGEGAVVIATEPHLHQFEKALKDLQINTTVLMLTGQLLMLDADEMLSKFIENEIPNSQKFDEHIANPLLEMRRKFSDVKAYGEMVNILWAQGNLYATMELEKLWNQLLSSNEFSLLCSYSLDSLSEEKHGFAFHEICQCHSHVIPAEGVINVETPQEQLKSIAQLQFSASAREKELKSWKMSSMEMMIPLTALRIQLRDMKNTLEKKDCFNDEDILAVMSKCDGQINRMKGIIEKLSG
jgi:hypothetical protein